MPSASNPRARAVACLMGWLLLVLLFQGCASVYKPKNTAIKHIDGNRGYRFTTTTGAVDRGDHLILLTFSGGGTRAAALSYGVLQELRDTQVKSRGKPFRLLDEVDMISSVSGGSFTAGYYGLFGDRIFQDYERVFLRQKVQGALIRQLFDPGYWFRSLFTAFDRTEMAIDYYDTHIFEGKTFADMGLNKNLYVEINATDLGAGQRFSFTQGSFDLICSNLDDFLVARAVTASSAVPVAFPPVVLRNHGDQCDTSQDLRIQRLSARDDLNTRQRNQFKRLKSYADVGRRPYIHLVDGGIADNLGLRSLIERMDALGSNMFLTGAATPPKDVLVVSVNAEIQPDRNIERTAQKPAIMDTVDAMTTAQISLYNQETRSVVAQKLNDAEAELARNGHDIKFHFVEVTFESLKEKELRSFLNTLPTSLELPDSQIDVLIDTGRRLLRGNEKFKAFLASNGGRSPNRTVPAVQASAVPAPAGAR